MKTFFLKLVSLFLFFLSILTHTAAQCPSSPIICDNFENYEPGSTIAGQNPWWTTWSNMPGSTEDAIVSTDFAASGVNSLLIAEGMVQDILLLLENHSSGQFKISWKTYIPSGATGFYSIIDFGIGNFWNFDIYYNKDGQSPGTGLVLQSGNTFSYLEDEWFKVEHFIDLDNDMITLTIDEDIIESSSFTANIDAVDFFSIDDANRCYIDDVGFEDLQVTLINDPDIHIFENAIEVYPNPVKDFVNLAFKLTEPTDVVISISNSLGQLIRVESLKDTQNDKHKINLQNLPTGIYYLNISNEMHSKVIKLILQ